VKLYQIVQCYNMTTGEVFWRVYDDGKFGDDGIADFPTVLAAAKAVQRFIDADKRRAKV
jgi:hypothetical protein